MGFIEVGTSRPRGLLHVVALVHIPVHTQPELLRRRLHELPEAPGIRRGHRVGEARFNDGEVLEVQGDSRVDQNGLDHGEPPTRPLEGQQAAAVPERPDQQLLFHALANPDPLEGKRGAGKFQSRLDARWGDLLREGVQRGHRRRGCVRLAHRGSESPCHDQQGGQAQGLQEATGHAKGVSKSRKNGASASFGDNKGSSTPQSICRSGSFQRKARSCSGL